MTGGWRVFRNCLIPASEQRAITRKEADNRKCALDTEYARARTLVAARPRLDRVRMRTQLTGSRLEQSLDAIFDGVTTGGRSKHDVSPCPIECATEFPDRADHASR
jgi:hypothetical protein